MLSSSSSSESTSALTPTSTTFLSGHVISMPTETKTETKTEAKVSFCAYLTGGFFLFSLAGSLVIFVTNEIKDSFLSAPPFIPIVPIDSPQELAVIHNSLGFRLMTLLGTGGFALFFDSVSTFKGFKKAYDYTESKKELMDNLNEAGLSDTQKKLFFTGATVAILGSFLSQIVNGYNYVRDDEDSTQDLGIPSFLTPTNGLSMVAAYWSTFGFFFNEGKDTLFSATKYLAKRKEIDTSTKSTFRTALEYTGRFTSGYIRGASSTGAILFSYCTTSKTFNLSIGEQIPVFIFVNTPAGITDFGYNGESVRDFLNRFSTRVENLLFGEWDATNKKRTSRIWPGLSELISFVIAVPLGGMLAFLQRGLLETYYKESLSLTDTSHSVLSYTITQPYSIGMSINYMGVWFDSLNKVFSTIGDGVTLAAKAATHCAIKNSSIGKGITVKLDSKTTASSPAKNTPQEKKEQSNGPTLFKASAKNPLKEPLLAPSSSSSSNSKTEQPVKVKEPSLCRKLAEKFCGGRRPGR
jgi:hypothetical protein